MSVLPILSFKVEASLVNSTHMGAEQVGLLSAPHPGDVDAGERRSVAWRTSKWSWPALARIYEVSRWADCDRRLFRALTRGQPFSP